MVHVHFSKWCSGVTMYNHTEEHHEAMSYDEAKGTALECVRVHECVCVRVFRSGAG